MSDVYASVDLGGTNIKCCMGTSEGEVLGDKSVPTESHRGPQAVHGEHGRARQRPGRRGRAASRPPSASAARA